MPRLPHVGAVLDTTAQHVAVAVDDAYDVILDAIADGVVTEEEVARIRASQAITLEAIDQNCDAADRVCQAFTVVRSVVESLDGKRTRAAIREWTVIEGGLRAAEVGPGVA